MQPQELFDLWAPEGAPWSPWVKPVLFAHLHRENTPADEALVQQVRATDISWLPRADEGTAVILDLRVNDTLLVGARMAQQGFQPVILANTTPGPNPLVVTSAWYRAIRTGPALLQALRWDDKSPPVFLLDSDRTTGASLPRRYDNRWMVFPQDLPSANALKARGIQRALLVEEKMTQPEEDLSHVLRRWQEGGIELSVVARIDPLVRHPLDVKPPSRFRKMWQRAMTITGLRRNSAGGFGAVVPDPSQSSGYS